MKFVEPQVYLIGETRIDPVQLRAMLDAIGGSTALDWFSKTQKASKSEGELLTEVAGRICYKSFGVGLNPNVTKIRQSSEDYVQNTLSKGDGSIFEHASCTFAFVNVSRVLTHELVRHRVGVAISQESLRYVRPSELGFWLPPELAGKREKVRAVVEDIETRYKELEKEFDWEAMNFDVKKRITSALRRMAPDGMATSIVWTANHRTIRHVITMRTAEAAEVEIRYVFDRVARTMKERFPLIYADFEYSELPDKTRSWRPKYVKV
ncbi:MAG TPA: FAD-dependent thymidylate synthase [Nitrososphaerales archaeon]|nr:FAD-dependent thymidylate synthase [Nitrososphaerales archaeon]